MPLEILTRVHLPIAPVDLDEVARLADVRVIGVFWFEQDSGNLYFVSDSGLPSPFLLEDGDLYYIVEI